MGRLARAVSRYLDGPVRGRRQIVQLFDSWVGCLGPADCRRYVLPHSRAAIAEAARHGPVIHFATGNPALLPLLREAGGTVIGIDWRIELDERLAGRRPRPRGAGQPRSRGAARRSRHRPPPGRRDPRRRPRGGWATSSISGHGVLPQTPVENVLELIAAVKGR